MLEGSTFSSTDLTVRPARPVDAPFLEELYRTARPDLQRIDAEPELIDVVVEQQYRALEQGAGSQYPNAMQFVIEKLGERLGAFIVDFGLHEVRVIYLAFIPAARGRGHGRKILLGVQQAAATAGCPISVVVWRNNPQAKRLYQELGFRVEESQPLLERMTWYPGARDQLNRI